MKIETAVIVTKGFCVVFGTTALTLSSNLAQWSNSEDEPSRVQWVIILCCSIGTGLTALGAFLSNSFGNYLKSRNGVDITATLANTKP